MGIEIKSQDIPEIAGSDDTVLLEWAADQHRILLTHDFATMVPAILRTWQTGLRTAPVVLVPDWLSIGQVIGEILLLDEAAEPSDWAAGVVYLPLR